MSGLNSIKKLVVEVGDDCGNLDDFALFRIGDFAFAITKVYSRWDLLKFFPRYRIFKASNATIAKALDEFVKDAENVE